MPFKHDPPLIGIVGVCASGKTTLIAALNMMGYYCRHIAQEHSFVPDMWRRLTDPDILIYLDVSYENTLKRKNLNWTKEEYLNQVERLQHAFLNADILIDTNPFSAAEVRTLTVQEIERHINNPKSK